jgi:hypothetical protein
MMDPKLMAILKKAKAVDTATAQKNGEQRTPARRQQPAAPVNRDFFDEPEIEYLTEAPMNVAPPSGGGGGGLFDQMGVSSGGSGGGPNTPSAINRMDSSSSAYESSVESSGLPPAIMKAMLDNPIPIGDGGTGVSEDFIREINPNMGRNSVPELPQIQEEQYEAYDEEDEGEYYSHPIQEQKVRPREVPNTQRRPITETTEVGPSEIRKMIAQEIALGRRLVSCYKFN